MFITSELVSNEPPDFGVEGARVGDPGEEGRDDEGVLFPDGIAAPQEARSRSKYVTRLNFLEGGQMTITRIPQDKTSSTDSSQIPMQMPHRRTAGRHQRRSWASPAAARRTGTRDVFQTSYKPYDYESMTLGCL